MNTSDNYRYRQKITTSFAFLSMPFIGEHNQVLSSKIIQNIPLNINSVIFFFFNHKKVEFAVSVVHLTETMAYMEELGLC